MGILKLTMCLWDSGDRADDHDSVIRAVCVEVFYSF